MEEILKEILAELKKINDKPPAFMSPPEFARFVNLPEPLIRLMARQGQISHLRPQKKHIQIDVVRALEDLRKHAGKTAEEIAYGLPVPVKILKKPEEKKTKKSG